MSLRGGARCVAAAIPSTHETAAVHTETATMTTNITDEHRRAFEPLTSSRFENCASSPASPRENR